MVGDTVKKASSMSDGGGGFTEIKDFNDAQYVFLSFPCNNNPDFNSGLFCIIALVAANSSSFFI